MFLKKVLNQPNVVGTVMIALLFGAGFVYAFAFDGFNVETVPGSEVHALIELSVGPNYGKNCDNDGCVQSWAGCTGSADNPCTNCTDQSSNCTQGTGKKNCKHGHQGCRKTGGCPYNPNGNKYCSSGGSTCPQGCNKE